jgi:hypothetical protein
MITCWAHLLEPCTGFYPFTVHRHALFPRPGYTITLAIGFPFRRRLIRIDCALL